MYIVAHPTGNTNVRAVIEALLERDMLNSFVSTLGVSRTDPILRLLPAGARQQVIRRAYPLPAEMFVRHPYREMVRLAAGKFPALKNLAKHEIGWASFDAVATDLDRFVAHRVARLPVGQKTVRGVYCYEDCALSIFKAAGKQGMLRIYDLPIAYWETARSLMMEETERLPNWKPTLTGMRDSAAKYERKTEELSHADVIMTPSGFVYRSLPESIRQSRPCYVMPFGSPTFPAAPIGDDGPRGGNKAPLRVLFVGSMTQRKGLADLFAAIKLLKRSDVELVVMGSPLAPHEFYRSEFPDFKYEPPRPHAEVLKLMQTCDVFVLPSIVEGRALVQQEAMACGLPLIVTANAGAEDVIEEGETGFLVPIRSPEAIAEKIAYIADHRELLPHMRASARAKAATYTWQNYGKAVVDAIEATSAINVK